MTEKQLGPVAATASETLVKGDLTWTTVTGTAADGVTDDKAALASSDDAALTAELPLMLTPGTYFVDSNLTIDSPVWFTPGAIIKPDDGITVTLAGGVALAPPSQVFDHSAGGLFSVKKGPVSVLWFGAVGDGATDTAANLTAAFAAGADLLTIPIGDYKVETAVPLPAAGRVVGEPGARIFSETLTAVVTFVDAEDLTVENIVFETVLDSTAATTQGVVYSNNKTLTRVKFLNCAFKSLLRSCNGVKIIAENSEGLMVDDFVARGCVFETGRMAFEVQDHTDNDDRTVRARNVRVVDSDFYNCGDLALGIALSYSGPMEGCASIDNRFHGGDSICIEYAREHRYADVRGNRFYDLGSGCDLITMTNPSNSEYNYRPTIADNVSVGRSGDRVFLVQLDEARMWGNKIVTDGTTAFYVRACRRIRANNELYDSMDNIALYLEGLSSELKCERNVWVDSDFTMVETPSGAYSVVRFNNAYTQQNVLESCRIHRSGSGSYVDEYNGAIKNEMRRCSLDTVLYLASVNRSLSDADYTMPFIYMDADFINFTGTLTAGRTVTFLNCNRVYTLKNSTAHTLTITVPDISGSTVPIPPGGVRVIGIRDNVITPAPNLTASYTATNVSTDRAFDADTVAVAELADVVGTLIADLKSVGVITP